MCTANYSISTAEILCEEKKKNRIHQFPIAPHGVRSVDMATHVNQISGPSQVIAPQDPPEPVARLPPLFSFEPIVAAVKELTVENLIKITSALTLRDLSDARTYGIPECLRLLQADAAITPDMLRRMTAETVSGPSIHN